MDKNGQVILEPMLRNMYLTQNLSQRDIAKKLKIPRRTIRNYLLKYNIEKSIDKVKESQGVTLFQKSHKENLDKPRPDMQGNNYAKGLFEEKSPKWKGEDVGYNGKHLWIHSRYGKAKECSLNQNHKSPRFHWANISGKYHRRVEDFIQLCPSCHRNFDLDKITLKIIQECRSNINYKINEKYSVVM
jgi:hypothetical protein